MGLYTRKNSPYWWMANRGRDEDPQVCESTKIPRKGATADQTRNLRRQAEEVDKMRAAQLVAQARGLVAKPKKKRPAIAFNDYVDWYDTNVSVNKPGHEREQQMFPLFKTFFGTTKVGDGTRPTLLSEVTRVRVREYRTHRLTFGKVKASTVNRELNLFGDMLTEAVPTYLRRSPIAKLRKLREQKFIARPLMPEEEPRLMAELSPADRAMLLMGLDTLMRLSDIFDAEWTHDHETYLDVPDSKNGEGYKVPISRRLRAALDALARTDKWLFPHRRVAKKEADRRKAVRLMLKRACKRAGIPYGQRTGGVTWHAATRHTGTTRMVEQGVHLLTIKEVGNWKTLSQLEKYAHPSEEAKRTGVEAVARALEVQAKPTTAPATALVDINHRVRHRPDLERVEAEAIAAVKKMIAEIAERPASDLPNVTCVLHGYYTVREIAKSSKKTA